MLIYHWNIKIGIRVIQILLSLSFQNTYERIRPSNKKQNDSRRGRTVRGREAFKKRLTKKERSINKRQKYLCQLHEPYHTATVYNQIENQPRFDDTLPSSPRIETIHRPYFPTDFPPYNNSSFIIPPLSTHEMNPLWDFYDTTVARSPSFRGFERNAGNFTGSARRFEF